MLNTSWNILRTWKWLRQNWPNVPGHCRMAGKRVSWRWVCRRSPLYFIFLGPSTGLPRFWDVSAQRCRPWCLQMPLGSNWAIGKNSWNHNMTPKSIWMKRFDIGNTSEYMDRQYCKYAGHTLHRRLESHDAYRILWVCSELERFTWTNFQLLGGKELGVAPWQSRFSCCGPEPSTCCQAQWSFSAQNGGKVKVLDLKNRPRFLIYIYI